MIFGSQSFRSMRFDEFEETVAKGAQTVYEGCAHLPRGEYCFYFTLTQGDTREKIKFRLSERELHDIAQRTLQTNVESAA